MALVFLESLLQTPDEGRNWWIEHPEVILQTEDPSAVVSLLHEIDELVAEGYFVAGFLSYEAGCSLLPNLRGHDGSGFPLVWFACTRHVQQVAAGILPDPFQEQREASVRNLRLNLNLKEYTRRIETIRRHIERGDTYQVNFTMRYSGDLQGSARALYTDLRKKQRVSYAAYVETEDFTVLSFSPELFFRKKEGSIWMRPMKGTGPRGRTPQEDEENASQLRNSTKERSENLMIVDLLRNDLGKICEPGSVKVTRELDIERYETVLQMTSTVVGRGPTTKISDVLAACFPSGSVTGAPKIRTMQIIHELEEAPRKIYTGSIGFILPASAHAGTGSVDLTTGPESVFSVAIRTILIENATGRLEMGVGSGILYEADAEREYRECELKAKFLTDPPADFQLFETMLWKPDEGFCHLPFHLQRLASSARHFVFPLSLNDVESALERAIPSLTETGSPQRVKVICDHEGKLSIYTNIVEDLPDSCRVRFSDQRTCSGDLFLYHKTTRREVYDAELSRARSEGFFDILFCNERGEVTEGGISNIIVQRGERYYTPPVSCGLLAGVYRRYLLEGNVIPIEEMILYRDDLLNADSIFLTNSVRGMVKVELVDRADKKVPVG